MRRRLAVAACLVSMPAAGQEAPRILFPVSPAPRQSPNELQAPIKVQELPTAAPRTAGLSGAEAELAGPLWARGAPVDLAMLLQRLPDVIAEPTLAELQRSLLAAPGTLDVAPDALLGLRVDRLLAMGEAGTALELLAAAPETPSAALDALRLRARFAAGQTGSACKVAAVADASASPWAEAVVVCAALERDSVAVEAGLDRLAALDIAVDPSLAGLARAVAAGGRFMLRRPVGDDAVLLPLLRSVALDTDSATVAALPVAARRAVADNSGPASAARAAAVAANRSGPSIRPELNGVGPADWAVSISGVPPEQRARWAALVDGLGVAIPNAVWSELERTAVAGAGPAPDLFLWRGFERADLLEQRGTMLLYVLLLLDGRPEAAAPVTLRRALDALLALGLERHARALAAGTGGALGL